MSIGILGVLGLAQELTYGTEITTPVAFGEFSNEKIDFDNGLITPALVGGVRGHKRVLPGAFKNSGTFALPATPEDLMGWILKGVFGQCDTTALGGGAYKHEFNALQSSKLPSFTLHMNRVAGAFNYTGVNFGGLNFSMKPNGLIDMTVDVSAQNVKEATPQTPTYTLLDPWTAYDAAVTLNNASDPMMEDLTWAIKNTSEGVYTLNNQRYIGKNVAKQFETTGSFKQEFDDMDSVRRIWGNAAATAPQPCIESNNLQIDIVSTCQEIGSSGYYYSLSFLWDLIYYSTGMPQITGPYDRVMMDVSFVTKYNPSTSRDMLVTLINSQSGYPDPT